MAVFSSKSRYRDATTYAVLDRRGRRVVALAVSERPVLALLGEHLRREGQRLDHLANFYFADPSGFWRIAELNEAMLPEALSEVDVLKIPTE